MKLGILVESEEGLDWRRWRATFQAVERLGFESLWISDHLQSAWQPGRHGLEPWTALAVATAETERIVLGPLVSPITFREPTLVARMAEALDQLSEGRFVIGLGLGWNADEHAAAGVAFPSVTERSRRLIDGIQRIRTELGERRVPVLVGGKGARSTLPIVARHADEWNVTPSSPSQYARAVAELERCCQDAGRDPGEIRRSVAVGVLVGGDGPDVETRGQRMRKIVAPLAQCADVLEAARGMGWLVGTPEDVINGLKEYARSGVERAILGHYDLDDVGMLELIAEQVQPALA